MEYRKQQELNNMKVIYDDLPVSRPVPIPRPETKIQMPAIVQPISLSPMVTLQESVVLRQAEQSEISSTRDYTAKAEDADTTTEKKRRGKVRLAGFFMLLFSLIYIAPFVLPLLSVTLSFPVGSLGNLSLAYGGEYNAIGVLMSIINNGFSLQAVVDNAVSVVLLVTVLFAALTFLVGLIKLISGGGANARPGSGAYIAFSVINLLLVAVVVVFNIVGLDKFGIVKTEVKDVFLGNDMALALMLVTALLMLIFAAISSAVAKKKTGYID